MKENMPIKHHLDKFNKIILELKYINIKIDDKNQAFYFVVFMTFYILSFYWYYAIRSGHLFFMEDEKASLNSRELRKKGV